MAGYDGEDQFTYSVRDDLGARSNTALVTLVVHQPPVAVADNAVVVAGQFVVLDILANDSDPDGTLDATSVELVTEPEHGTVTIDPTNGSILYAAGLNEPGQHSFTYTVRDNYGAVFNVASVDVTVLANQPPVAEDDSGTLGEGQQIVLDVLANDSDPDGTLDATSVELVTEPEHGTVTIDPTNGSILYVAGLNEPGQHSVS